MESIGVNAFDKYNCDPLRYTRYCMYTVIEKPINAHHTSKG